MPHKEPPMKLILDTLEAARLTASPAEADALRVALIDLEALAAALDARGLALDDAPACVTDFKALAEHAMASENGIDESEEGFALSSAEPLAYGSNSCGISHDDRP